MKFKKKSIAAKQGTGKGATGSHALIFKSRCSTVFVSV